MFLLQDLFNEGFAMGLPVFASGSEGADRQLQWIRDLKAAERADKREQGAVDQEARLAGLSLGDEDALGPIGEEAARVRKEWLSELRQDFKANIILRTIASSRDNLGNRISLLPPFTVRVYKCRPFQHELDAVEALSTTKLDELGDGKEIRQWITKVCFNVSCCTFFKILTPFSILYRSFISNFGLSLSTQWLPIST